MYLVCGFGMKGSRRRRNKSGWFVHWLDDKGDMFYVGVEMKYVFH